jgi:Tfp pilus assembly protein PilF
MNPQMAVAQNNLAMILATRPDARDEALALAQQAVSAAPAPYRAGMYDTLAFVQGQRGDYAGAIASIEKALALMPNEPKYQVRLAAMLIGNQQIDRAKRLLEQLKSRPGISPQVEKEIEELQKRIKEIELQKRVEPQSAAHAF